MDGGMALSYKQVAPLGLKEIFKWVSELRKKPRSPLNSDYRCHKISFISLNLMIS